MRPTATMKTTQKTTITPASWPAQLPWRLAMVLMEERSSRVEIAAISKTGDDCQPMSPSNCADDHVVSVNKPRVGKLSL